MSQPSPAGLHVRPYRHSDADKVRKLFVDAMVWGANSPYHNAQRALARHPCSLLAYGLSAIGFYLAWNGNIKLGGMVLLFCVAFIWMSKWQIRKVFLDYMELCIKEDMGEIGNHYGMVPANRSESHVGTKEEEGIKYKNRKKWNTDDLVPTVQGGFWVVESYIDGGEREIVGTVGLYVSTPPEPMTSELRRLTVSPAYRGRGLSSLLIHTLLAHAKEHGIKEVILWTTEYQAQAIKNYQRFGWVEVSRSKSRMVFGLVGVFIYTLKRSTV